jgi:hypothetical protein
VLNDGVRERTKDLSSTLAAAKSNIPLQERLISIQADTAETREFLVSQQRVAQDAKTPVIQLTDSIQRDQLAQVLRQIHYDVSNSDVSFGSSNSKFQLLLDEIKHVPDDENLLKGRVSMINHIIDDMKAHRNNAQVALSVADNTPSYVSIENPDGISAVRKQAVIALSESAQYSTGFGGLDEQVELFSVQVQRAILLMADREETRLRWLNYASYLLFFLGWAIGPLAKTLNIPGSAGMAE